MKFQHELAKSLLQVPMELPAVSFVLEAHHEIVGKAHNYNVAMRMPPPPLVDLE